MALTMRKCPSAASGTRDRDRLSQPVIPNRVRKISRVVNKYQKLPGAPRLPAPKENSKQAERVMKDLQEHGEQIDSNAVM
jgi:hypothetical protein